MKENSTVTIFKLNDMNMFDFLIGFDPKKEIAPTHQQYTAGQQQRWMGEATKLIDAILFYKGKKDDLKDAIRYALCVLDCRKYGLDITDAMIRFRIQ